jgi:hypothetical protein
MRFSQRLYVIILYGYWTRAEARCRRPAGPGAAVTSSRMGCLLDSLDRGYRVLGICSSSYWRSQTAGLAD